MAVTGPDRAKGALNALFANSLHEYGVHGADRILFHLAADKNLKMQEVADVSRGIFSLNPKARIILGITLRPEFKDKLKVMLFAVGCTEGREPEVKKEKALSLREIPRSGREPKQKLRIAQKKARLARLAAKRAVKPHSVRPGRTSRGTHQEKKEEIAERTRKTALDLKQELDGKLQEIQEEEKKWDIPAFLRVKIKR